MRHKLELMKPIAKTDRFGSEGVTYEATRIVWAERIITTGNRSEEVGEHFANYSAQFNVRDAHPVAENWRVRQIGGYLYTVVAIVPHAARGYNTLVCERVNE